MSLGSIPSCLWCLCLKVTHVFCLNTFNCKMYWIIETCCMSLFWARSRAPWLIVISYGITCTVNSPHSSLRDEAYVNQTARLCGLSVFPRVMDHTFSVWWWAPEDPPPPKKIKKLKKIKMLCMRRELAKASSICDSWIQPCMTDAQKLKENCNLRHFAYPLWS